MGVERMGHEPLTDRAAVHTETIRIPSGQIEAADVPASHAMGKRDVFCALGYGETIPTYYPAMQELSKRDRRVLSLNHPRRERAIDLTEGQKERVASYPPEFVMRALNIIDVLEAKTEHGKIDGIGHSLGAVDLVIAALLHPEKFRNIVLLSPAGLVSDDSSGELLVRFLMHNMLRPQSLKSGQDWNKSALPGRKREASYPIDRLLAKLHGREIPAYKEIPETAESRDINATEFSKFLKYINANKTLALKEALSMAGVVIADSMKTLERYGVHFVVMSGVDDPVFNRLRIAETISAARNKTEPNITKRGVVRGFAAIRGGHHQEEHPEVFMPAVEDQLTKLELQRSADVE